uniref:transposase n=1 Tax=Rickettsia rhipicephali TaxID=33992 RepID=UPI003969BC0C
MDQCDGLSFVDSSSIEVCKKYRISMNKVFAGIVARGANNKRLVLWTQTTFNN